MPQTAKVYDYKPEKVRRQLQTALRSSSREASVADLVSRTGLPTYQVEDTLKTMLDEQHGQLKATDTGELLYYFPEGFRNRKRGFFPWLRRTGRTVGRSVAASLVFLFKIWIVSMLVGYFVLFILLLVAALLASVAGTAASRNTRSRTRMGGFGSFYLTTRLVQIFISLWLYSSAGKKPVRGRRKQPLHQTVFAYVFGDADPEKGWERYLRKTTIRFIQSSKGVITLDELIKLTGKSPEDANAMMNEMLREYEGNPQVTEEGTVYYSFPGLMTTTDADLPSTSFTANKKELKKFNSNPPKTNRWITFFNGFNLLFGSYFLYYSLRLPVEPFEGLERFFVIVASLLSNLGNPLGFMLYGLGVIPVLFSITFFLVTGLRRLKDRRKNARIKRENLRKTVYEAINDQPEYVLPGSIIPVGEAETPKEWETLRQREVDSYAAYKGADIRSEADGREFYKFGELKREQADVVTLRNSIDTTSFGVGEIIYDSGENPDEDAPDDTPSGG
jgi:hypothetical protein